MRLMIPTMVFVRHMQYICFRSGFRICCLSPVVNSLLDGVQSGSVRAGGLDRPFVGVQFFKQALLEDGAFLPKLSAAFGDLVYQVPIILVFSLFVAVILNQKFKGRGDVYKRQAIMAAK